MRSSDRDGQGRLCRRAENAGDVMGDRWRSGESERRSSRSRGLAALRTGASNPPYFSINNKAACFPGFDQFN